VGKTLVLPDAQDPVRAMLVECAAFPAGQSAFEVAKLRLSGCTQIQGCVFWLPRPTAETAAMFVR